MLLGQSESGDLFETIADLVCKESASCSGRHSGILWNRLVVKCYELQSHRDIVSVIHGTLKGLPRKLSSSTVMGIGVRKYDELHANSTRGNLVKQVEVRRTCPKGSS